MYKMLDVQMNYNFPPLGKSAIMKGKQDVLKYSQNLKTKVFGGTKYFCLFVFLNTPKIRNKR